MDGGDKYSLVLASLSPRRKELLGHIDIPFEIYSSGIEEVSKYSDPVAVAEDLAMQKGRAALSDLEKRENYGQTFRPFVISSDTLVAFGDKVYGKPRNRQDARRILLELSGKTHLVATGVYFGAYNKGTGKIDEKVFSVQTEVTFSNIDDDLLSHYLDSEESLDKAGAYGIQGKGLLFVSKVNGSYSNVVGLPLRELYEKLHEFFSEKDDYNGNWRNCFVGV